MLLGRLALDPPRWWPWVACAHRAAWHLEWLVRGGAAAAVNRRQMPCERVPAGGWSLLSGTREGGFKRMCTYNLPVQRRGGAWAYGVNKVQRRQNSWGGVLWRLCGSGVSEAAAWWSQGATKKKGRGSRRKTREYTKVYIQDSYLVDPTAHLFSPHSKRPGRSSAATSLHWQVQQPHPAPTIRDAAPPDAHKLPTATTAGGPMKGGHSTNADHESQSQQSGSGVLCSPKCPSRTLTATVAEGWSSARQSGSHTALLQ
ncbi:hypothetical protein EDB89DRAFT_1915694 [Lactarius sanguifluus]|nr:hypothetical protein EDB89DRAFT_1915694 [Lactarius sanguifluus]